MKFLLSFTLFILCALATAQKPKVVYFHLDSKKEKFRVSHDSLKINYKQLAFDTFKLRGYIGIEIIDSIIKKNELHYSLKASRRIKKIILTDSLKKDITTFEDSYLQINKKLGFLENNGFPFAQLKITDQYVKQNKLYLSYKIDSGNYTIIDKIHIKSKDKFNHKTILNIINLKTNEPYSENKLKKISSLLSSSKQYSLLREPEVLFKEGKAEIYIYLKKEKSSSADGYIGLLQDKTTQKVTLNGYINLALNNSLNRAELINFNWKSSPDKTQNLKFNLNYPYLFNTPFGVESNVDLHKQDTSFIRSLANFGINYKHGISQIGIFNKFQNSTLLNDDLSSQIRAFSKRTFGLKLLVKPFFVGKLKFYEPQIEIKSGLFSYKSDSIKSDINLTNYSYDINLIQSFNFLDYFKFTNSSGIKGLSSSYDLSRNELVYFGGLKSVRGFYELELVGNEIFTFLNEIEYQPISALAFKLIYDYSSYKNNAKFHSNSFGVGFGLKNENSILEIIIANGVINDNPIDFNSTKIHIGFSSSF